MIYDILFAWLWWICTIPMVILTWELLLKSWYTHKEKHIKALKEMNNETE